MYVHLFLYFVCIFFYKLHIRFDHVVQAHLCGARTQVDPTNSGRVAAPDAAIFLKRSGLADVVLGKIWDLADSERKGGLNKQQFFVALRLVACAQNGLEVALKSLNVAVPPPKFHDTSSPLLPGGVPSDYPWVVKPEEKKKFDSIFESLGPAGGMLTGDKVKPVLLNSKLPVDILGRVWELSDLDRDGMLDRDEFSVAMYLVYRALEGEPVPMSLPPPLVPPSKRKKPSWVVSTADKAKYDELFAKTDSDMDGLVSGPEVRDIFLKTGLPSGTLARIWELCDIGDLGKLTRDQFALALHLINQKLTKGLEPPQSLSPEMIPPSDRQNIKQNNLAADFSAIKELDSLSNEIVELQRVSLRLYLVKSYVIANDVYVNAAEPDLFATKKPDIPAAAPESSVPFSTKRANPAVTAPDPFSSAENNFGINNKNIFQEDNSDVPPALPPKTGTPTRPPPPPPGKRSSISRTESSDSFHRRGNFLPQSSSDFSSSSSSSSLPAKDPSADPFAPSSPPRHNVREADRFASFDKYPTEEDMIEWAKRESEREEKERLARLTQQEQEDLELAIALSKSELS
uniref:Epidermal growth factor receptor pathway substrate 15 n=1 Tax=Neogobius melanostomus TaxID=47308 RepID=A0A8C6S5E2_9GOBI